MVAIVPLTVAVTAMSKSTDTTVMTTISSPEISTLKPSKSILKTPTNSSGVHKRKKMDMDISSDPSSASPSPKKRVRVTFEMDAQQQPGDEDGGFEKSTAVVSEEVRRAIQRHLVGNSDAYDRVKELFVAN